MPARTKPGRRPGFVLYTKAMKVRTIAVIAAGGRSGRACVTALLAAGYHVRAGVHGSGVLPADAHLEQLPCDATNADDIARVLTGADAVVNMIGHTRHSPADVQTRATARCIEYITSRQPDMRYIGLTGTGVRQAGDRVGLLDWLGNAVIRMIDPARIRDGIQHAKLLEASTVRYSLLRVLKLGNGSHVGAVRLTPHGPVELLTPRVRVAAAVVRLIESDEYERAMPVVSRTRFTL